ncbi:MAG: leucine-rich repeat protein, partial [Clostridia bacterium]|nr:leucine-rich repeat protein [Clostridia bacterium]
MTKKFFSLILICLLLPLLMVGCSVPDDPQDSVRYGVWGGLNWTLYETTGELIISGIGEMDDFSQDSQAYAWREYKSLIKSVTITEGVTTISEDAFSWCTSLTSISIPASVTAIGNCAFYNCYELTDVYYEGTLEQWCVITYGERGAYPQAYADNLYVDGELLAGEVIIPSKVTKLQAYTFAGCNGLTGVTIPASVTSIEDCVFPISGVLNDIYYAGTIAQWLGITFSSPWANPINVADRVYIDGKLFTGEVVVPSTVTEIKAYAFAYCEELTSVVFEENSQLTAIGKSAFENCCSLKEIAIPDGVITIGDSAFSDCDRLTSITIPDSVITIGNSALSYCDDLTSVKIPASVTAIGSYVFHDCDSLRSISVDKYNAVYHSVANCLIETESKTLVAGCKNSAIPTDGSVTTIGDNAFSGCSGFTGSLVIPDSVTEIIHHAFSGCSGFNGSLILSEGLTE